MSAHTLPPWGLKYSGKYGDICSIVAGDGHGKIATVRLRRSKTNNYAEKIANAHLLSASPYLLQELKEAVLIIKKLDKEYGELKADIRRMETAVALAEGRMG